MGTRSKKTKNENEYITVNTKRCNCFMKHNHIQKNIDGIDLIYCENCFEVISYTKKYDPKEEEEISNNIKKEYELINKRCGVRNKIKEGKGLDNNELDLFMDTLNIHNFT